MQQRIELPIDESYRRIRRERKELQAARVARREAYEHKMLIRQRALGVFIVLLFAVFGVLMFLLGEGMVMLLCLLMAAAGIILIVTNEPARDYEELEEDDEDYL